MAIDHLATSPWDTVAHRANTTPRSLGNHFSHRKRGDYRCCIGFAKFSCAWICDDLLHSADGWASNATGSRGVPAGRNFKPLFNQRCSRRHSNSSHMYEFTCVYARIDRMGESCRVWNFQWRFVLGGIGDRGSSCNSTLSASESSCEWTKSGIT